MNYTNVTIPKYGNSDNSCIDCMVDFEAIGVVPFTACPMDDEAHGVEIYNRCIAGDFGPIAPYVEEAISDHDQALIDINALESTVTNRRLREAALTDEGKAWLQNVDDDIAVLRASL